MNLPAQFLGAAASEPGVYRCAPRVNGRPIWYRVGHDGRIADVRIVADGEREPAIAAQLVIDHRATQPRPTLKLVTASPASRFDLSLWWPLAFRAHAPPRRAPALLHPE